MWDDGWTAVTADGRRTAQFEHTLVVTEDGAEVLTLARSAPAVTVSARPGHCLLVPADNPARHVDGVLLTGACWP